MTIKTFKNALRSITVKEHGLRVLGNPANGGDVRFVITRGADKGRLMCPLEAVYFARTGEVADYATAAELMGIDDYRGDIVAASDSPREYIVLSNGKQSFVYTLRKSFESIVTAIRSKKG